MSQHASLSPSQRRIELFGRWVIKWRWVIVVLSIVSALGIGSGGKRIIFSNDYRYFFSKENPQLTDFETLQKIYSKNDNILFVLEPEDGNVFGQNVLSAVEKLTAEAWKIPYATRVDSISNFQHTEAEEDDLIVADLVDGAEHFTSDQLEKVRRIALNEPLLLNRLIPKAADVTGVNVTLELPGKDLHETTEAVGFARELDAQIRSDFPGIRTYITGFAMLNNAFSEASMSDLSRLIPLMYLCILITIGLLLRSVAGTIATVAVIAFSSMTAMGMTGWLNIPLTPPSSTAPTVIMTLAVADSIHILVTMLREMRLGMRKRDAILESLRLNMQPVFLTSLTTAIGFLSMNFSDAPPFRDLGNITAMGVLAAFVFSVVFLPALVAILPVRVRERKEGKGMAMERVSDFVVARRRPILWVSVIIVLVLTACITKNELNDKFVDYFDHRIPFRADTDFTSDRLTGIYAVEFSLGAEDSSGISEPAYLAKVDEFARWWRTQPNVMHVRTFTDTMKRLNMNMHGDDPFWYKLPESRELAAQYLLLYEMSLPYGLDLNNEINVDKSATRFTVTLDNVSTKQLKHVAGLAEQWLRDHAPETMFTRGVGPSIMFAHISARNIRSMLIGSSLALILISGILIFALRSVKYGLVSLVPNLVPIATAFGLWGIFRGNIGVALSVVTAMTLGVVVDDTVHFLSKYIRARREQGLDAQAAVHYAFASVGTALVVTSCVLFVGFAILSLSAFRLNGDMGQLTAITILLALLADFTLLPALLMRFESRKAQESATR